MRGLDLRGYEVDRQVYDKGWFNHTVIYKLADKEVGDDNILN